MNILKKIPLFKSHYSIGKSILTLEDPKKMIKGGPDSIIDLAIKNKIKDVYLVEDGMTGFLEAYSICKENNLNLKYGLRINYTNNALDKSEESLKSLCKMIIFIRNTDGYKLINKIYHDAHKIGFYYEPRVDTNILKKHWNDENLLLANPFYDSAIFQNLLTFSICIPDFSFTNKVYNIIENNELWFDDILKAKIIDLSNAEEQNIILGQSVYYANYKNFKEYLTFRCINNRSTLEKPQLDHMTSNTFCLENCRK